MQKRKYTHIRELMPEIQGMYAEGKTQREIAEHYGFTDKQVVKNALKRERRRERKIKAGIPIKPKGRPRKESVEEELCRLRMENKLLRDFLKLTERM